MEGIIISLLFLYPGAAIELLYQYFAKYGYKEENQGEQLKLAKFFVYSTVITMITIALMGLFTDLDVTSLSGLVFALNSFETAIQYLILSVLVTCVVAWVRYKVSGMDPNHESVLGHASVNGCKVVGSVNTWRDLIYGQQLKDILGCCIARIITPSGSVAGFVTYLPPDFEKGISLDLTLFVERQFEIEKNWKPEQRYIGEPYIVYVDTACSTIVEFYDGKELKAFLEE